MKGCVVMEMFKGYLWEKPMLYLDKGVAFYRYNDGTERELTDEELQAIKEGYFVTIIEKGTNDIIVSDYLKADEIRLYEEKGNCYLYFEKDEDEAKYKQKI